MTQLHLPLAAAQGLTFGLSCCSHVCLALQTVKLNDSQRQNTDQKQNELETLLSDKRHGKELQLILYIKEFTWKHDWFTASLRDNVPARALENIIIRHLHDRVTTS